MFDGFLGLEIVHWEYRIHHFIVHRTSTLGHISPSRDCHIPHHFGYSFEVGFRVSPLRHWSILYSDFLADYCWAEDSWLMMLDSSFGCALYIHIGAYSLISSEIPICYCAVWLSLFMVIEMFGWFWQTLYCTSDIHTGAYSPLLDEIVFGQWYEDGWSLLVVCLTTSTSDIHTRAYSPPLTRFCLRNGMRMDD